MFSFPPTNLTETYTFKQQVTDTWTETHVNTIVTKQISGDQSCASIFTSIKCGVLPGLELIFLKIKTSLSQTYAAAFDSYTQWTNVLDKAIVWAHSGTAHMDKEQQAGWADGVWDLLFWKPHRHTDTVAVSFIFTAAHSDSSLFLWYMV